MSITLFSNNDNIVDLEGLRFEDGNFINEADVNLKISDYEGAVKLDKLMEYISNSNGNYRVVVPHTLDVENKSYYGEITVDINGRRGYWEGTVSFKSRRMSI